MVVELRGEGGNINEQDARKSICRNSTKENKRRHRSIKIKQINQFQMQWDVYTSQRIEDG